MIRYIGACFLHWGLLILGIKKGDQAYIAWEGELYRFYLIEPEGQKQWTIPTVPKT